MSSLGSIQIGFWKVEYKILRIKLILNANYLREFSSEFFYGANNYVVTFIWGKIWFSYTCFAFPIAVVISIIVVMLSDLLNTNATYRHSWMEK